MPKPWPASFPQSARVCRGAIAVFGVLMAVGYVAADHVAPDGRRLAKVQGVDTVGYFSVAHSLLFDHDFDLRNEYARNPPSPSEWTAIRKETGLPGSPWGVGYSILQVPMLAAGTALDMVAGNPGDGYSTFAVYLYGLGSVLITALGLWALFELLLEVALWRGASETRAAGAALFSVFAVYFGTSVGYYSIMRMAHASSFLFASLFLLQWWRIRDKQDVRSWILLGGIGAFLSISRWQDVLYVGGPIIYDVLRHAPVRGFRAWFRARLGYAAAVLVCCIPQFLEWKAIYGKYVTIPQGGGFISFPPTHIAEVLFSARCGWLLWTPLVAIGLVGLVGATKREWRVFAPWWIVLILELVVIGAMATWHGFDSFGARYMLTNTTTVALGLVFLLSSPSPVVRRWTGGLSIVCTAFTVLFMVQYGLHLIPKNEPLTPHQIFAEKLMLRAALRRNAAVRDAQGRIEAGDSAGALRILEPAMQLGDDDEVLRPLIQLYRAKGDTARAAEAARRMDILRSERLP